MERRARGKVESEEEEHVVVAVTEEKVDHSEKGGGKGEESEADSGTSSLSLVVEHIQRNITSCPLCAQNFVTPKVWLIAFSPGSQPLVNLERGWQNMRSQNLGIAKIGSTPCLPILAHWWI